MAAARNINLALGLMTITNEALQLDMLNLSWRMTVNLVNITLNYYLYVNKSHIWLRGESLKLCRRDFW
jgi:hypothetical protein